MTTHDTPASEKSSWEEVWETDLVDAIGWAALFAWAGLVVLASYTTFHERFDWWEGWAVFWLGAGVILLIETGVRLAMPAYRSTWWWTFLWGIGLLSIGLGSFFGWAWVSLFFIAVAAVILGAVIRNS